MVRELMIAAFIPPFAEREVFWFEENTKKIKGLVRHDSFWKENTAFIEEGARLSLSEFMRKLDDMRYEKTQSVSAQGEFTVLGGIVTIFPINLNHPVRVEFLGNYVEKITPLLAPAKLPDDKREKLLRKEMLKREISHLHNLKIGDYLVHLDHGIGIFKGMVLGDNASHFLSKTQRKGGISSTPLSETTTGLPLDVSLWKENGTLQEQVKSYYLLEYAPPKDGTDPDKLFVPEDQVKKLSLYIGFQKPAVHRLSGTAWEHAKRKITEDARKLAEELLAIYAKRHSARRPPYPSHHREQAEFDGIFEHIETPDQQKAIADIFADMDKDEPMDRLLCGDVGFGKTEVAMRAAFRAVHSGKQIAVLCPTTILADQHFATFSERFGRFPVNIGILSRFESKKAQKETVRKLKDGNPRTQRAERSSYDGKIDIIIGTHRLLSSDVEFKNLGLLIIDEEQRFGVKQKEKLKKMRETIDVLSLSATPIPRTLYLALSGLRRISVINTPPFGRIPIETFVLPYDKETIQKAIREELHRRGQTYFLHNKIETIEKVKEILKELVPEARFETIHGRTPEARLRAVMQSFKKKQCDVLVSTTIIENGLDIKNANTLIVDDATRLGLAQAYQIRGRIGRAEKKAKAYFLYPHKILSEDAQKRLEALEEATELGSGYFIAQKDLEIRGAGNILGKAQSGAVNQVGLNLYCQILNEAIENSRT